MALTEPAVTWQKLIRAGFAVNDIASRPLLDSKDLDAAIDHRGAAGSGCSGIRVRYQG
jgi:hypothetical protein